MKLITRTRSAKYFRYLRSYLNYLPKISKVQQNTPAVGPVQSVTITTKIVSSNSAQGRCTRDTSLCDKVSQ